MSPGNSSPYTGLTSLPSAGQKRSSPHTPGRLVPHPRPIALQYQPRKPGALRRIAPPQPAAALPSAALTRARPRQKLFPVAAAPSGVAIETCRTCTSRHTSAGIKCCLECTCGAGGGCLRGCRGGAEGSRSSSWGQSRADMAEG